jgi:hypothetical protein
MNTYRVDIPVERIEKGWVTVFVDADDEDEAEDLAKNRYYDEEIFWDGDINIDYDAGNMTVEVDAYDIDSDDDYTSHHRGFGKECPYFIEEINQL